MRSRGGRRVLRAAGIALVAGLAVGACSAVPGGSDGSGDGLRDMAATVVGAVEGVDVDERVLCRFDSAELDEVSGITLSRQHKNTIWVTNDSGGGPYLYAVSTKDCRIRATLRLLDTPARDHEALAAGVDDEGRDVIWIGDIGDNVDGWPYARIHKVIEPAKLRDADVPVTTYRYTYPDGPVNAEAMLAAPDREQLWIITKESGVGALLELPSPMSPSRTPMEAVEVGTTRALITDAAMAPDGTRYVVRDYLSAEVFSGEPPGQAQARFRLPLQPQGESITWTADGRALLVASEGSEELVQVSVPRTALGTDSGIADVLPRVAGFDIYPYVRIAALVLAALIGLVVLRRVARRLRRR